MGMVVFIILVSSQIRKKKKLDSIKEEKLYLNGTWHCKRNQKLTVFLKKKQKNIAL